jgi:Dictyostelium (slime mold) repeat
MSPIRTSFLAVATIAIGCGTPEPKPEPVQLCPASIDDGNPCTVDSCNPATGAVTHEPLPTAILSGRPTGSLYTAQIPPSTTSGGLSVCPNGPTPGATPPECLAEIDFSAAPLTFEKVDATVFRISGSVPIRIQDLPVAYTLFASPVTGSVTFTGNQGCPGATQTFQEVQTTVTFDTNAAPGALSVTTSLDQTTIADGLALCESAMAAFASFLMPYAASEVTQAAQQLVTSLVESQLCVAGPSCPDGSTVDENGLCRYSSGLCVSRGLDSSGMPILPVCFQ